MIRFASEKDFSTVMGIWLNPQVNKFMVLSSSAALDEQKKWFERQWREMLVFEENSKVIGFLSFRNYKNEKKKHIVELIALAVNPESQGKGVATALFKFLIENVCKAKLKIEAAVVTDNEKALGFYENFGFVVEGKKENAVLQDRKLFGEYLIALYLNKVEDYLANIKGD